MTNRTINIAEAKAHLSELVEKAAAGEAIVLTRRGKPVALMSSLDQPRKPIDPERLRALVVSACSAPIAQGADPDQTERLGPSTGPMGRRVSPDQVE